MTTEGLRLREAIAALAPLKSRRRYPVQLRERVVAYARHRLAVGQSRAAVCAELTISEPTLDRFLSTPVRNQVGFAPVVVREASGTETRPVVRGPGGVSVEGLSIEGIAQLLRRLACSD